MIGLSDDSCTSFSGRILGFLRGHGVRILVVSVVGLLVALPVLGIAIAPVHLLVSG